MEQDIDHFLKIIDEMNGKFKLIYNSRNGAIAFQEREEHSSKVRGMVLERGYDYVVTYSCGDIISSMVGVGFDVRGKLYEATNEEFERVVCLSSAGSHSGDRATEQIWTRDVRSDITFIRDAEKIIYEKGFILPKSSVTLNTY